MATQKPDYMTQQAWDYLLQFTVAHEAMVLHMYNNRASETAKQDAHRIRSRFRAYFRSSVGRRTKARKLRDL